MANAILFYRTPASTIAITADPQDLPSGQILEFVFSDDLLEGLREEYRNNIKQIPVPNQDGVRKLNVQENGLQDNKITINGVFSKSVFAGVQKLKAMRKRKQVDTFHLFGIIGLEVDNAPEFDIDPTATAGMFIDATTIGYAGIRTTRYDFSVTLGFGGTIA